MNVRRDGVNIFPQFFLRRKRDLSGEERIQTNVPVVERAHRADARARARDLTTSSSSPSKTTPRAHFSTHDYQSPRPCTPQISRGRIAPSRIAKSRADDREKLKFHGAMRNSRLSPAAPIARCRFPVLNDSLSTYVRGARVKIESMFARAREPARGI